MDIPNTKIRFAKRKDLSALWSFVRKRLPDLRREDLDDLVLDNRCIIAEETGLADGTKTSGIKIIGVMFFDYNADQPGTVMLAGLACDPDRVEIAGEMVLWFEPKAPALLHCRQLMVCVPLDNASLHKTLLKSGFIQGDQMVVDNRELLAFVRQYEVTSPAAEKSREAELTIGLLTGDDLQRLREALTVQLTAVAEQSEIRFIQQCQCLIARNKTGKPAGFLFFSLEGVDSLMIAFFRTPLWAAGTDIEDRLIGWLKENAVKEFGRTRLVTFVPTTNLTLQKRFQRNNFKPTPVQRHPNTVELEYRLASRGPAVVITGPAGSVEKFVKPVRPDDLDFN